MIELDETHAPERRSWVAAANERTCDFSIQNLPFGVFKRRSSAEQPRVGVAIGDQIVDVTACAAVDLFRGWPEPALAAAIACCRDSSLNALMGLGPDGPRALRRALSEVLRLGSPAVAHDATIAPRILVPMRDAELLVPARVGDYSDFYASIDHATNVGRMLRPDNPLLPNYKWVPIGYHGRASSIVVSGTPITRPVGQTRADDTSSPVVGPSRRLDYELEMGIFIGHGNEFGAPIHIGDAERHLFGLCLLNDWSARDIQTWEYQPLGPFLAKSFATSISPWIVTMDALAPFRARAYPRPAHDPSPLPYLFSQDDANAGGFDIRLDVSLSTARMRGEGAEPFAVSAGNTADLYWTPAQFVVHHTSNGCNLRPGDLLGSGTVSGPAAEARGCLLERTWRGSEPLRLPNGETRAFLEDGDEVVLRGYCERSRHPRVGFGECRGIVLPPRDAP